MIKAGAFGSNGTLTIGGGAISADTILKLYAPGSNGSIDFVANVTLSSESTAAIIAANKVTIVNGVLVTIGGQSPAAVFTNVANYTGSGGNESTTGTFGGNGAVTNPFSQAPPFDEPASAKQPKDNNGHRLGDSKGNDGHGPGNPKGRKGDTSGSPKVNKDMEPSGRKMPERGRGNPGASEKAPKNHVKVESSTQLLTMLEGAEATTKKGKVVIDPNHAGKAATGKEHSKVDRGAQNASSKEEAKRDRPVDSTAGSSFSKERAGHEKGGASPTAASPAAGAAGRGRK